MSLIQHVGYLEGTDREEALVDVFLPPLDRQTSHDAFAERRLSIESGSVAGNSTRSMRRIVSYDALRPIENTLEEDGGVTPYHVSTTRRIGEYMCCLNPIFM